MVQVLIKPVKLSGDLHPIGVKNGKLYKPNLNTLDCSTKTPICYCKVKHFISFEIFYFFNRSMCWSAISSIIFVGLPELLLALLGPANGLFCHYHIIMKNIVLMHFSWLTTTLSFLKLWYIFVAKIPFGPNDDFWNFFLNSIFFILSLLSQIAVEMVPGKSSYFYYICIGELPISSKQKINYPGFISGSLTTIIYMGSLFATKIYQWKIIKKEQHQHSENRLKFALANFWTLAMFMVVIVPAVGLTNVLNRVPFEELINYPFNVLVNLHLFVTPCFVSGVLVLSYYLTHPKLQIAFVVEMRQFLLDINSVVQAPDLYTVVV